MWQRLRNWGTRQGETTMLRGRQEEQGFTLIAALLLLFLISGLAAGLVYLLNSEQKVGANDLQGSMAYYGTEAAMEKMASDLGDLYTQKKNPKSTEIQNLGLPTPGMVPS